MILQGLSGRDPIGLDIGRRAVKAVQMRGSRLTAAVSIPRAGDGAVLDAGEIRQIAELLARRPFRGRSVVVAVPPDRLITSILELPPRSSGAPVERLARMELARCHQVAPESVEMACWDMPAPVAARAANRTYVMAVACRQSDAEGLVGGLESAGLSVRALDVHALAIGRACRDLLASGDGAAGILDVGWSSSRLALLYKGTVVYERNLSKFGLGRLAGPDGEGQSAPSAADADRPSGPDPCSPLLPHGGRDAEKASAPSSGAAPASLRSQFDAIASEVGTPLSYLANQYPNAAAGQLLLVGGGAGVPGLAEFLADKLNVPVRTPELADLCPCDSAVYPLGPEMALAVGLARWSAAGCQ